MSDISVVSVDALVYFHEKYNCCKGLVTNYGEGGATKREGGHVKFYPYEKGGQNKF